MSKSGSKMTVIGIGDIARLLNEIDKLRIQGILSINEFQEIKEAILAMN